MCLFVGYSYAETFAGYSLMSSDSTAVMLGILILWTLVSLMEEDFCSFGFQFQNRRFSGHNSTILDKKMCLSQYPRTICRIFLEEQRLYGGDATLCCVSEGRKDPSRKMSTGRCRGARGICKHFYDSAPVGQYGTGRVTWTYFSIAWSEYRDSLLFLAAFRN